MKMNTLILFSGGVDSTALIPYYKGSEFNIKLLWINYGQKSCRMEELAVNQISKYYNIELTKLKTGISHPNKVGYEYIGRNLFLISTALMVFPFDSGLISLGIRLNSDYKDCSSFFVEYSKQTVESLTNGVISLDLPLLKSSKKDVIEDCLKEEAPLNLTFSCDEGGENPCGFCPSCIELNEAYEQVEL